MRRGGGKQLDRIEPDKDFVEMETLRNDKSVELRSVLIPCDLALVLELVHQRRNVQGKFLFGVDTNAFLRDDQRTLLALDWKR